MYTYEPVYKKKTKEISDSMNFSIIYFVFLGFCILCLVKQCLQEDECSGKNNCLKYKPHAPLVRCEYLQIEFLQCDEPEDLKGNETLRNEQGHGCTKWGGERYEDVQMTSVKCTVLEGIDCYGNKTFFRGRVPCIKYTRHYFVTTLIYSVLLGFLGMDRFCLGHTAMSDLDVAIDLWFTAALAVELAGTAVGKLLTLGGVGIWWIVDIILLVRGVLIPEDGSNWIPYY